MGIQEPTKGIGEYDGSLLMFVMVDPKYGSTVYETSMDQMASRDLREPSDFSKSNDPDVPVDVTSDQGFNPLPRSANQSHM